MLGIVAVGAGSVGELAGMFVLMTAETAAAVETEIGPIEVLARLTECLGVGHQFGAVAGAAVRARVSSPQLIACSSVVETRGAVVAPEYELEGFAVVLHMAPLAPSIVHGGVKAEVRIESRLQGRMAAQASIGIDSLLRTVATHTLVAALEPGVNGA